MAAPLLAPASASAILVGAESNGKLVNSNITYEGRADELDKAARQGVQVIRGNWGWNEVAMPTCATESLKALESHTNPCYNWMLLDQFVEQVTSRRMQVLLSVSRTPSWLSGTDNVSWMGNSAAEFNKIRSHYVAFHKAAATRYRKGSPNGFIQYWTVHNESNSPTYWAPRPNPQRYAVLYAQTAVAIKTASPFAQVAPGPTNPTGGPARKGGIQPLAFIRKAQPFIQRYLPGPVAKKRRYLNAWAHNPYPGITSQPHVSQGRPKPDQVTMSTVDRLFKQLDRNPVTRGTKVWATEFGWETSGNFSVPQARQAQFIAEAYDYLNSKRRVAIGISYGITDPQDPIDWQSGTFTWNGRAKQSYAMYQRMVSVPQAGLSSRVRRGTTVKVFGRSNVSPRTGVLAFKQTGSKAWRVVPRQRRAADGSITATMRLNAKMVQFAVFDRGNAFTRVKGGYGPTRIIRTY